MATYVERVWHADDAFGLTRRDRTPGTYLAYVPDELGTSLPKLGAEAISAAEDALGVLARADERVGAGGGYLNHLLIRSESISSSWIEGNRVTPKRLAIAELVQHGTRAALDVIANVRATESAIDVLADRGRPILRSDIEQLQRVIEPTLAPGLRREQNWVGGSGWSPLRAEFVPPPESEVARLTDDLADFVTETSGNPVVRAAIAHAQFETIHPFIDGNGRTGRALIHTVLRRADALRNILIPISTVFAGQTDRYIEGLTAYRSGGEGIDQWVIGFARAAELAAANAVRLVTDVQSLGKADLDRLIAHRTAQGKIPVRPRRDSVVLRILDRLASEPVWSVQTAAQHLDVSTASAHRGLAELADAGILSRNKDQRGRLICWSADRHLALVSLTERSNRVGGGDTAVTRPRGGPPPPDSEHVGRIRGASGE